MPQTIQRSFTAGEISPSLRARADIVKYTTGCALLENFFVRSQGGVYSRPGTKFVSFFPVPGLRARLIPFQFSTEQTYVLVFQNFQMFVIKNGAMVLSGGLPYTLALPYSYLQIQDLGFTQDADVMTLTHPLFNPKQLKRFADDNWTITDVNFAPSISAPTWAGTPLTAVGTGTGASNKTYTYVVTAIEDATGVESLASTVETLTTPSLTTTAGIKLEWNAVTGASNYRVYKDPSDNTDVFGWIGNSKTTEFTDYNLAPVTSDSPPIAATPFSASDKPSAVGYYQQRLVFGNTISEPQTLFFSQTGIYNSLRSSVPSRDDDAITFTINSRQVNEIRHIVSIDSLIILTSGAEYRVTEGQDQVITPSTIGVKTQSYYGASKVPPVTVGDSIVFIQEKGSRLRDLKYQFSDDKTASNDLTIMSEHLLEGYTIEEMAYSQEPYSIIWMVRNDGVLLGLTYQREHQVVAWHKHTTDGFFESVCVISEDGRDAVYVVVRRTVDGTETRYVERFEPRDVSSSENTFCVDSGLTYDGSPTNTFAGLDHLEGKTVVAVADGYVVKDLVVTSGSVTLPRDASKVSIGLPYTCVMETLDLDMASTTETLKGKKLSVSKVILDVEKSRGGWVGPKKDYNGTGTMLEIKPRFDSDGYDPIALRTGKEEIFIDPQWSSSGGIRIEQRSPLPMAILAVIPDVDIS